MFHSVSSPGLLLLLEVGGAATLGVASHLWFFIHGEHHMKTPLLARAYLLLFSILLFVHAQTNDQGAFSGALTASLVFTSYVVSLLTSIGIYRLRYHRLRGFPGPLVAGLSKLWHVAHVLDSRNHVFLEQLYEQYGEFVRTGRFGKGVSKLKC